MMEWRDVSISLSLLQGKFIFYMEVANPLLSVGTTGSIEVECYIKPLKHNINTKKHNGLESPKGVYLLRAREKLNQIWKTKLNIGKKMKNSH